MKISKPQAEILQVLSTGSHKHHGGVSLDALKRKGLVKVIRIHWPTRQFCGHFNDYALTSAGKAALKITR
jgi:hypothetical protein